MTTTTSVELAQELNERCAKSFLGTCMVTLVSPNQHAQQWFPTVRPSALNFAYVDSYSSYSSYLHLALASLSALMPQGVLMGARYIDGDARNGNIRVRSAVSALSLATGRQPLATFDECSYTDSYSYSDPHSHSGSAGSEAGREDCLPAWFIPKVYIHHSPPSVASSNKK